LVDYFYYSALTVAALYEKGSAAEKKDWSDLLTAHRKKLHEWAVNYRPTFTGKHALVSAEIARVDNRDLDAMRLYEEAIRAAYENGFVENGGVANELAGQFYLKRGIEKVAYSYLRDARYCYLRWGAHGKVRQLEELYPRLWTEGPAARPTSTIEARIEQLDLATVTKVSQAISSEIVLEKLIDTFVRTAVEHAGAERGLLILARNDELRIEAEATTTGGAIVVHLGAAPLAAGKAPESIFHYVVRTRKSVILDDASVQNPFSSDDYIRLQHVRSVLCLPLLKQARLTGVLYLENNLASGVFTPKRLAMLELLASQAAISVDHAQLYAELARENSERKRVEQELGYQAELLKTVTDNAKSALYLLDHEGRVTFVNPSLERMTGYRAEELIGQSIHDMIHHTRPDGSPYPAEQCSLSAGARQGRVLEGEDFFVRKDGAFFPVHYVVGPIFREGVRIGTFNEVQDLTKSKAAEAELKKQAQLLALAHDAIIELDSNYRIKFWNLGAVKTYGWTAEEAIGKVVHELLQTRFPVSKQAIHTALHEYGQWEGELTHLTREGKPIVVTSRLSLQRGEKTKDETVLEINRDITERRRAEEAWQKAQAELARVARVAMLGELTTSMAHEVNQPLGAIANNAGACVRWLGAGNLEEARRSVSLVIQDAHRAGEVIGRVRAWVRKAPPHRDWLDLNQTIREVIAMVQGGLGRNRVLLRIGLTNDLPPIMGDRVQLQQVILNLANNAIEATGEVSEGPREVSISSKKLIGMSGPATAGEQSSLGDADRLNPEDQMPNADLSQVVPRSGTKSERETPNTERQTPNEYVLVSVADTGPGLDPDALDRVFEAFYSTKPQGLGMGLAISRTLVEAHGGKLWAMPNQPKGALFQFTLPLNSE
ncbi:MAG: PAS domain S-box protein, partial [Verrucomicrobia bacterium]|nr:PAS domain S-box protein [Verrucomicrobiota bacterium]